ncbi:hypothetical protein Goklo_013032, partial [Gossypium klotzschianum]|nr:hypothetical protein [Gossypium klotzschianum]
SVKAGLQFPVGRIGRYLKERIQIVKLLLRCKKRDKKAVNRSGETAFDTAEKTGQPDIAALLQLHGVQSPRLIKPATPNPARKVQTVSDIQLDVYNELERTRKARELVRRSLKRLHKMQSEGLNNAMNSTTVVAVLIATVSIAGIFQVPGQYVDDSKSVPPGLPLGEARIVQNPAFVIFFISDSLSLFLSLSVVVVQTSVVVIASAKKKFMAVINRIMWLACVLVLVAYIALSFVVVGDERWLAIGVTIFGSLIMSGTLGTMFYLVFRHRIKAWWKRNILRSFMQSESEFDWFSDTETSEDEPNNVYVIL